MVEPNSYHVMVSEIVITSSMHYVHVCVHESVKSYCVYFRFKSARKTDGRVRIMNEVITGIRVIKMYAWEYAFKRVVNAIRK